MRGPSGRLIFDVDPDLKRRLHAMVARQGRNLKDWFLESAEAALREFETQEAPTTESAKGSSDAAS